MNHPTRTYWWLWLGLITLILVGLARPTDPTAHAADGVATLVKDFDPTPYQPDFSVTGPSVEVNGTIFFAAWDATYGEELWRSDGTTAGTLLFKDVWPGEGNAKPSQLTAFNGKLLFVANDGSNGLALWLSDGSSVGTVKVKDVVPLAMTPSVGIASIVLAGGRAFFCVCNTTGVLQGSLWVSDGTPAGTRMLNDLILPINGTMADGNGTLFFRSADGSLWKSDGTLAGTIQVAALPASEFMAAGTLNGTFVFFMGNPTNLQIWTSDGTAVGTGLRKEFPVGSSSRMPDLTTIIDQTLYFVINDAITPPSLWRSDGTASGTVEVKQFTASEWPQSLTTVNQTLFLIISDNWVTQSLWISDGTTSGTVVVKQFSDGGTSSTGMSVAGRAVFPTCSVNACQIWSSDGSATGTILLTSVKNGSIDYLVATTHGGFFRVCHGAYSGMYRGCSAMQTDGTLTGTVELKAAQVNPDQTFQPIRGSGHRVFFAHGWPSTDLWVSDGTPAGTTELVNIASTGNSLWTFVDDTLFFVTYDGNDTNALWKSDGTPTGTAQLKSFARPLVISQLTNFAGSLVFMIGNQLWQSDGTTAGTLPFFTTDSGEVRAIIAGRTQLFFTTCTDNYLGSTPLIPCFLWSSDGTAVGTRQVATFDPVSCFKGCDGPTIGNLRTMGDRIVFTASQGNVWGLWTSDGTATGTRMLHNESPSNLLTTADGQLFFTVGRLDSPSEPRTFLWISDGTVGGTHQVAPLGLGGSWYFTAVGNHIFSTGYDNALWTSDGTAGGTHQVVTYIPLPKPIENLTAVGTHLFFTTDDGSHGNELWTSDGSEAGTYLVADLNPGPAGSLPTGLSNINGQLFFSAWSPGSGRELWVSDDNGTRLVQNIAPGLGNANPTGFVAVGPKLLFGANDGSNGPALWALPLSSQPFQPMTVTARTYIQAENYDLGGEGLAYHDTEPSNRGGVYRPAEGVDLTTVNQNGSGGTVLAWTKPGEWLNYSVNIANTRAYTFEVALAALGAGGSFHLTLDGADVTGPRSVPDTGGWYSWQTLKGSALNLTAGRHTLRLVFDSANATGYVANLDWFVLDGASTHVYAPEIQR